MKGLVFEYKIPRLVMASVLGMFSLKGYLSRYGHLTYGDLSEPRLLGEEWVVIKTHYCGICGSDHKQVFLDGNMDNPMTAVISWPQVLGHEVVGTVVNVGAGVKNLTSGDRVALNPWLSCLPRGIHPPCKACRQGKSTLCRNFTKGNLTKGIHTGNSSDATGGFAELVPAHESMAIPIPDGITWEQAVLSDPFSVAFHSILKVRPKPGSICAVYGCGNLGLLTVHILKKVFDDVTVIGIACFKHQADMARRFGADLVLDSSPVNRVIEKLAEYLHCEVCYLKKKKKPWLIEGVDFLFDTVATPETLETGIRIVKARAVNQETQEDMSGSIVVTGVSSPKRFEWTPWYFKDLRIIGSNAFAMERFEGRQEHAYHHYFRLLDEGRIEPSAMVSHKFPLADYKDALVCAHDQEKARSLKVVFSFNGTKEGIS